jgi:hypothetical protein
VLKNIEMSSLLKLSEGMAAYVEGLAMGWYSFSSSPKPKLKIFTKEKVTTNSEIYNVELKLLLILICS